MTAIKFGTDGWRAIIADDFTVNNVKRVAAGTALWLKENGGRSVVIGHDCRFGGKLFADTTARIIGGMGLKVFLADDFVSTPMVSLAVLRLKTQAGIVITASHNPPSYNGYKIKSHFGGPAAPADIERVEQLMETVGTALNFPTTMELEQAGLLEYIDLEGLYVQEAEATFDLPTIIGAKMGILYDAMYGAGQRVFPRLLPAVQQLHCDFNPSFYGRAPEPILRNLGEMHRLLQTESSLNVGVANDGDADRIGMFDHRGQFIDSHHMLLLLVHYLHHYKGLTGKVIITFSVSDKVKKLCQIYGLPIQVTKIGFKYIAEIMAAEDVLVGGEESGGIAVKGAMPERDGIWIALTILEFMAKTGKSLHELVEEVYAIVGPFSFDRDDLHVENPRKEAIIAHCKNGDYTQFGEFGVLRSEDLDGYKMFFNEEEWVMIRPSGTEPLLRVYCQANDSHRVRMYLDAVQQTLRA